VLLLREHNDLVLRSGYPPADTLGPTEFTAARWALDHREMAGRHSNTLPNSAMTFFPIATGKAVLGVIGLLIAPDAPPLDPERRRLLDALVDQSGVAIERANLETEIQDSRVSAEKEKLRGALLSSLSHDLRTPLAGIVGSVTSLLSYGTDFSAAARRDLLLTIQEEADRLNRFVANLLDMTRLESGAFALRRDWTEVADLVGSAVSRIKSRLTGRAIRLDIAPGLPLVRVDFVLLEQVLFNVLDNALKYAPAGSEIVIAARQEADTLAIDITDSGTGIPTADLERVFDKFYRVQGGDRQVAGTGLGLSICRGFVEAHGGTIVARSPVAGGHGTTIAIRLPVERQPAAAAVPGS
jgi:two-component system sensor histidine kinase KdpD